MRPVCRGKKPAIASSKVDFPPPEGPIKATRAKAGTDQSAVRVKVPCTIFVRSSVSMAASLPIKHQEYPET